MKICYWDDAGNEQEIEIGMEEVFNSQTGEWECPS